MRLQPNDAAAIVKALVHSVNPESAAKAHCDRIERLAKDALRKSFPSLASGKRKGTGGNRVISFISEMLHDESSLLDRPMMIAEVEECIKHAVREYKEHLSDDDREFLMAMWQAEYRAKKAEAADVRPGAEVTNTAAP